MKFGDSVPRGESTHDVASLPYEKMYRDLTENSLGLICSHDLTGKLLLVNHAAAEALGYKREQLEGKNLRDLVARAQRPEFDKYLDEITTTGTSIGYLRVTTRSGKPLIWLYRNKLYQDQGHSPIVLGHAQDVTWRLDMEKRLRQSNQNYRKLFEEAPVAYHEIDRDGNIVKLNRFECELLGYTKEQVIGRPVWDLVAPELRDESKRSVSAKLAGEQPLLPFVREYVCSDGSRLLMKIHENLIRSDQGEILGIRSALLDVTEQHRAEQQLRELNAGLDKLVADRTAELNASNNRMREFVYTVSHDLQEPLRSIGSFAKLLRERYSDRLDSDGQEFLSFVMSATVRMSRLIRDLLAYSRALSDDPGFIESVPLERVVQVVRENLSTSISSSGATISYGTLPVVQANPNRMVQLLQNLVGNAIKYRGNRPPVISINAVELGPNWVVTVSDNGIGISPQDRERVFGLFKRSKEAKATGSGLGLAICQAIVERHGGKIWVEAGEVAGSNFRFTLPIRAANTVPPNGMAAGG